MAQMPTHHASNGCNLRAGDLLASGTVSGADKTAHGCLLELTSRGKDPITLPTGEQRKFPEDGDEIILRGFSERDGFRRIQAGQLPWGDSARFRGLTSLHSPRSGMLCLLDQRDNLIPRHRSLMHGEDCLDLHHCAFRRLHDLVHHAEANSSR
jgi:hypothetical protein